MWLTLNSTGIECSKVTKTYKKSYEGKNRLACKDTPKNKSRNHNKRSRSDFEKHLTIKNCDKTFLKIILR